MGTFFLGKYGTGKIFHLQRKSQEICRIDKITTHAGMVPDFMKKNLILIAAVIILLGLTAGQLFYTGGRPAGEDAVTTVGKARYGMDISPKTGSEQEKGTADMETGKEIQPVNRDTAESETIPEKQQEEENILPERVAVKGIYATGYTAGSQNIERLIDLIDKTELNALVLDIKDASGYLTTPLQLDTELSVNAFAYKIKDLNGLVARLKEKDIYAIARIVVFKDPVAAGKYPELAVQKKSGGIWRDYQGKAWTNPFKKEVWDYNLAVALAAARAGFQEIQFDYVRFPADGPLKEVVYPGGKGKNKAETIAEFLAYARERLRREGVYVSADVFGLTCSAQDDLGIGQKIELIAAGTDYVSPMVYPSHYAPGSYGIKNPNASPYRTVYRSLTDAVYKTRGTGSIIRPWLQDFSYGYPYGAKEVRAQIKATYDAGLKEWILWNPSNHYTGSALLRD